MTERKLPLSYYNWISIIGAYIGSVSLLLIILFLGISFFLDFATNPYLGIVQFLILPVFLIGGLLLIPAGAYLQRRRIRKGVGTERRQWPRIDFNQKSHRNALTVFAFGSVLVVFVSAVGSYKTFHYTESVEFCGTVCHQVMKPEYVAYQNSPHARVACAACHIGSGANWYVKSKLSGAYQVYAVLANNYPRPIPTPVANLRPAQETCEQCHWPEKFFGAQQKRFNHFMYDEANTAWPIDLLIRTGGGDPRTGQAHGIHWHMNIQNKIEYVARDHERQDIPWVRLTDRTSGRVIVYQNQNSPLSPDSLAAAEIRSMDCMDCHNRPSHIYRSPDQAIDLGLLTGRIDAGLPSIKEKAVAVMAREYTTEAEALSAIATELNDYYQTERPDVYETKKAQVDASVAAIQEAFAQNIFPEMKVRWSEYQDNLGHFDSPGCMRCHNEAMVGEKGQKITTDCRACHTILSQGAGESLQMATSSEGLDFVHPVDIDDAWTEMGCYECHTGVQP
ncbi:MAG: NapC/NirT family cytochrome c [Candidatus Zixiibacteriota bacterium]